MISRKPSETMKLLLAAVVGIVFGFSIGLMWSVLPMYKLNLRSSFLNRNHKLWLIDIDSSTEDKKKNNTSKPPHTRRCSGGNGDTRLATVTMTAIKAAAMLTAMAMKATTNMKMKLLTKKTTTKTKKLRTKVKIRKTKTEFGSHQILEVQKYYLHTLLYQSQTFISVDSGVSQVSWLLQDLTITPKYLVTFTVGYDQRNNINAAVKKFSEDFTIVLFHYDGQTTEWDEFEWSKRAIHINVRKQTKWWYAKRFLHPDIVASYDYIFIWDEDLGVEHFNAEEYIKLVKKHGLEISQPGLEPNRGLVWQMTKRRGDREVHKQTEEKPGRCSEPYLPPCAGFVEIMAPVFSREAWRCVWHLIQNDLVHGWGLDFALRKCVELAHEKIGVVDAQWIVHQSVPSLGNQGKSEDGKSPWQGVKDRCRKEWKMFNTRLANAEKAYNDAVSAANSTAR